MSRNKIFNWTESVDIQSRSVIHFFGPLDENAAEVLQPIKPSGKVLDLSKISRVSTLGAGVWVDWTKTYEAESLKVTVNNVPPNFVRVLNSIPEMLPINWLIESFFVPYVRPLTDESENVLFVHGHHFNKSEINLMPLITSLSSGQKLELDVYPEMYFKFLRQRFPGIKINQGDNL